MGQQQADPPGVPQWEWTHVPENQLQHSHKAVYECNFMQALEGELDTTHVYFLHSRLDPQAAPSYGLYAPDRRAHLEIVDTNYGVMYAARRHEEDAETYYWRTTQFLFPVYGMFPGGGEDGTIPLSMYVPIDDVHTLHWGLWWHPSEPMAGFGKPVQQKLNDTGQLIGGVGPMKPHQTGRWFADWWPQACMQNDFLMNREVKKTKNFTGIPSVRLQDDSVITSMGKIMDRTREHLGTADAMVIRVRRRMLEAARALRERGVTPPGVKYPELYRVRSCQAILPRDRSWQDALDDGHVVQTAVDRFGHLDILVNNAGTSAAAPFESVTLEAWQADLDLKLFGAIRAMRAAVPYLRQAGGGSIVNLLNLGAKQPGPRSVPTSVSRAAG